MSETTNLGIPYLEVGQSGKELTYNQAMDIIDAALPAALTIPLPVAQGGTGASSLTDHGVLVGSGATDPVTALSVGATGTVLAGSTGADPAFTATPTVTSLTLSGSSGNILVCDTDVLAVDASNNRVGVGTASPSFKLHVYDTTTVMRVARQSTSDAVGHILNIDVSRDSGVGGDGLGGALHFSGMSSTTAARDMARMTALWTTAADASRTSALAFNTVNNAGSLTERMRLDGAGNLTGMTTVRASSTALQSTALIGGRVAGNAYEFGHTNSAGFGSTLGCGSGTGRPFLAFNCEHGTNTNTFLTRGKVGVVLQHDTAGALLIGAVTNSSADNQSLTEVARWDTTNGRLGIGGTPSYKLQIVDAVTDPAGTVYTVHNNNTVTLTGANTQVIAGISSNITYNQAGFNNATSNALRAFDSQVTVSGASGTVAGAVGVRGGVVNSGAGTLTTGAGYTAAFGNTGGGTFGTCVGYDMPATTIGSTATYGYRGSLASASTRWNLYMDGTAQNYLAGNLGIGVTTPTNALSFGGNAARTLWMERHSTANTAGNALTIQSGGATSGATDKAPGALLLATGLGTGNAVPALLRLQGDGASATAGTTDHSTVDRYIANAFKVLTDGAATDILSCTLASGSAIGGVIHYTIEVTDGTDFQSETGYVFYSAVNKAGAVTRTITEAADSQQAVSAGTLTTAWAISAASPAVVSVNADTSLTPSTGYPRITFAVTNLAQQAIAIA